MKPGSTDEQSSGQFAGPWDRLLLAMPGQPADTLEQVIWLQGPELYVDLRQPPAIASRVEASCLAELSPQEALLLAAQQGFAGRFVMSGDEAEWLREIDFQLLCALGDRGRLAREGDLLIEYGIEADYIEYWQRPPCLPGTAEPASAAARFRCEEDGRTVILVQHGRHFAYARNRGVTLPKGANLAELIAEADAATAQALIDCEISHGSVTAEGWRIDRSTLPWREGALLIAPDTAFREMTLTVADCDARGLPLSRRLTVLEQHGAFEFAIPSEESTSPLTIATTRSAFQSVPVIDVAALGSGDSAAEAATVARLRSAASEVGFLYVTGHGIAPALIDRLRAAAKRLFDLPMEAKMASYIGHSVNHRGYVPPGEEEFYPGAKDAKEGFDLALDLPPETVPPGHPMLGPNQWPDLPGFRDDVMAYYAAVFAVGRRLLRALAMALGQPPETFERLVITPPSQLRLLHYPPQSSAEDMPGIGAHTDYECFTLLLTSSPGLEVMNQAGQWIDAPPVPGALVVNIGDMMEFWSGGKFVATSHRVRKVTEERYSFPLFFALDYDVELVPLGQRGGPAIHTGEHLFAQTARTFRYLKARAERGEIVVPGDAKPLASFGRESRHRNGNRQADAA
ncbi:MAG: 2-oxoglutarate and iron-dependent oxygenase domain-containing protein [Novosphingobium sp.]